MVDYLQNRLGFNLLRQALPSKRRGQSVKRSPLNWSLRDAMARGMDRDRSCDRAILTAPLQFAS
ncbi:MAG: hypothetical protein C0511_13565 [Hyphomicrobium sp.]|nr:hypothetical protein [Hyphomicrobium sp.]